MPLSDTLEKKPLSHQSLIKLLKALGFTGNKKGVCYGLAVMGMLAVLANDLKTFNRRLEMLANIDPDHFAAKLAAVEEKRLKQIKQHRKNLLLELNVQKEIDDREFYILLETDKDQAAVQKYHNNLKDIKLSEQEQDLLDSRAFLEGVMLYFSPQKFSQLFEEKMSYDLCLMSDDEKKDDSYIIPGKLYISALNGALEYAVLDKDKDSKTVHRSIITDDQLGITIDDLKEEEKDEKKKDENEKEKEKGKKLLKKYGPVLNKILKITSNKSHTQKLRPFTQNAELTFPRGLPLELIKKIEKKDEKTGRIYVVEEGLIEKIDSIPPIAGAYTQEELITYFRIMREQKIKTSFQPLTLLLSSNNHSISVSHDHDQWIFIDANKLPAKEIKDDADLAKAVFTSFHSLTNRVILDTEIYARTPQLNNATAWLDQCVHHKEWEKIHTIQNKQNWEAGDTSALLHKAAEIGHVKMVKDLFEHYKADPNITNEDYVGPLYVAAQNGHTSVVQLLLEHKDPKVDLEIKNKYGVTPLWIAAQNGQTSVVQLLLEHKDPKVDIETKDKDGTTPLWIAAQHGHTSVVKLLLEHKDPKVDIEIKNKYGVTPLWIAAQNGHTSVVQLLLEHKDPKVDIETKDKDGTTPLWIAAQNGHTSVVQLLLEHKNSKVDLEIKNKYGLTPLWIAAQEGHTNVVQLLLEHKDPKVDLEAKNKNGLTPLWIAAQEGHTNVVKLLLEHKDSKVDIEIKNKKGLTPLLIAVHKGHEKIVELLIAREVNLNRPIQASISTLRLC
jgi:ankyrin repeat protein